VSIRSFQHIPLNDIPQASDISSCCKHMALLFPASTTDTLHSRSVMSAKLHTTFLHLSSAWTACSWCVILSKSTSSILLSLMQKHVEHPARSNVNVFRASISIICGYISVGGVNASTGLLQNQSVEGKQDYIVVGGANLQK